MILGVAGLNHRTAPIEVRERFYVDESAVPAVAREIVRAGAEECVVLSTCNRTECYFTSDVEGRAESAILGVLAGRAGMEPSEADPYVFLHYGRAAVLHLYRVASGLDSLVLGEPQIQGQVRNAYRAVRDASPEAVGATLHRLFQSALGAGGRVRAETAIGEGSASVPSAAVELAAKVFGSLEGRRAMVVGAGEMGTLTLRCLRDAGVGEILVASRRFESAAEAEELAGGRPVPYREFGGRLGEVDVLVTSAAAPHPILTAERLREARGEASEPLVVLDIALPRNVEQGAGDVHGVFLYNVDDLQRVVETASARRAGERPRAERLLDERVERFWSWYRSRRTVPLIRAMRERAERIRERELEAALEELGGLTPEERERFHMASRAALNKILHAPTSALRELAREIEDDETLEAVRRWFREGEEEEEADDGEG